MPPLRSTRAAHHRVRSARIRRALARSRVKVRVLLALERLGPTYAAELAREAHTSGGRLAGAMKGDGRDYARASSLVRLRLVRATDSTLGERFALTPHGARVARAWRETLVTSWAGTSSRAPA